MHKVSSTQPTPQLRRYVRAYAQRELYAFPALIIEPVPARLEQILNFEFGDPYEVRLRNEATTLPFHRTAIVGYQTYRRAI